MGAPILVEAEFELKWRMGVRGALLVNQIASRFESSIKVKNAELWLNTKEIMEILMLGEWRPKLPDGSYNFGPDAGAKIQMRIEGPDALRAAQAMEELFGVGERTVQCRNSDCISSAILIAYDS